MGLLLANDGATATNFASVEVWDLLIQIFILAGFLLLGNIVRRKVPFIRKALIPTSLIGGLFLLLWKLIPTVGDWINKQTMEVITYHCLAIGFIALALKKGKKEVRQSKEKKRQATKAVLETGVLQGAVYIMQGMLGLVVTIILCVTTGFFAGGGVILALGFGQGTGQALTFGSLYETDYGFYGGATFGATIASIGFAVASVVGVVYMNILRKKGKLRVRGKGKDYQETLADYVSENEIPNTEAVDKLTINVCIVALCYCIVYLIMRLVGKWTNMIWGFNFLVGTLIAVAVRSGIKFFQKIKWIHRDPTNNFLLDRISGLAFDIMIIAGVGAIDLTELSTMWWQILILCVVGTISTFIYVRLACNTIHKGYEDEGFFTMFGTLTGTASNGMILLREIDPQYETPAATNLVLSGLPTIVFAGGLLVLLNYCPLGLTQSIISAAILFVAFVVFTLVLFRTKIFRRKKAAPAAAGAQGVPLDAESSGVADSITQEVSEDGAAAPKDISSDGASQSDDGE